MFGFLKRRPSFRKQLKAIAGIDEPLRFCLYLELLSRYETEMDYGKASVLAAQVGNHLMGDDFAKVYQTLSPDVQTRVDAIKHLIRPKVAEAMTENKAVRELISRHIMTTFLIYHCTSHLLENGWFDRPEMRNRENLIREYDGNDIPEVESFDRYMSFALNFIHTRKQLQHRKKDR